MAVIRTQLVFRSGCLSKAIVFAALLISLLTPQSSKGAGAKDETLRPLLDILDEAKVSGSIQLSGRCELQDLPDLPKFRAFNSRQGMSLVEEVHEILRDQSRMQVTKAPDGTIRIRENGVPEDFLNVRIANINFGGSDDGRGAPGVYAPNEAALHIIYAPEVVKFMKDHEIEWPYTVYVAPGNLGHWPRNAPRVTGILKDVTVAQALDFILKTFPGVWVYQNCPATRNRERMVYLRFYYLRRIGSLAPFVDE